MKITFPNYENCVLPVFLNKARIAVQMVTSLERLKSLPLIGLNITQSTPYLNFFPLQQNIGIIAFFSRSYAEILEEGLFSTLYDLFQQINEAFHLKSEYSLLVGRNSL